MSLNKEHELHRRRKGRNAGVALMLVSFVALIMALTYVKITSGAFELPKTEVEQEAEAAAAATTEAVSE